MVGDIGLGSGFGGERSGADVEYVEGLEMLDGCGCVVVMLLRFYTTGRMMFGCWKAM